MSKKTIKTVGKEEKKEAKNAKKGKGKIKVAGLKGGEKIKVVVSEPVAVEKKIAKEDEVPEAKKKRKAKTRGKRYQTMKKKIDRNKAYSLAEAIKLVKETSLSKFVGNLEAHLLVDKKGEVAEVSLPYFKTKQKKVVIADDKIIAKIKEGKIDFDILLASPELMPRIVPLARVLGPKGLMPNPKNGTLIDDPKKSIKKFQGSTLKMKTEKKAPVLHLVLGKLDQPEKELVANVEVVLKAIGKGKTKKLILAATMGPSVKVALA